MNRQDESDHRAEPRGRVQPGAIAAQIERIGTNPGKDSVELVDVSSRGVGFVSSMPLNCGQAIQIHLACGLVDWQTVVAGTVRWTRPTSDLRWKVGCELLDAISPTILKTLAIRGVIDRRRHPRRQVSFQAAYQWMGSPERNSAHVVDISQSGACLATNQLEHVEDRLLITLQNDNDECVQLPAVARWTSRSERGLLIGCKFLVEPARSALPKPILAGCWLKRCRQMCLSLGRTINVVVCVSRRLTDRTLTLFSFWCSSLRSSCRPRPGGFENRRVAGAGDGVSPEVPFGGQADASAADSALLDALDALVGEVGSREPAPQIDQPPTAPFNMEVDILDAVAAALSDPADSDAPLQAMSDDEPGAAASVNPAPIDLDLAWLDEVLLADLELAAS